MRWIYLAVIILFVAATVIFALQNFEVVTMSFLGLNARVPLALLVAVAYLLGAATGGSLLRCCVDPTKGREEYRSVLNWVSFHAPTDGWTQAHADDIGRRSTTDLDALLAEC